MVSIFGTLPLVNTITSIELATRKNRHIDNRIAPADVSNRQQKNTAIEKVHGRYWNERKPPSGIYNCAGHVWAARRTSIEEIENEWEKIQNDDGYRRATLSELQPDDVAIYREKSAGIIHMARVIRIDRNPSVAWLVSKWDDSSAEYIHQSPHVPFADRFDFDVEYWTDRP